jgi:hypothetical protein
MIVETVDFFPEKVTLPFPSAQDYATQAAADLNMPYYTRNQQARFVRSATNKK